MPTTFFEDMFEYQGFSALQSGNKNQLTWLQEGNVAGQGPLDPIFQVLHVHPRVRRMRRKSEHVLMSFRR